MSGIYMTHQTDENLKKPFVLELTVKSKHDCRNQSTINLSNKLS